jgi:hypothetical protein
VGAASLNPCFPPGHREPSAWDERQIRPYFDGLAELRDLQQQFARPIE